MKSLPDLTSNSFGKIHNHKNINYRLEAEVSTVINRFALHDQSTSNWYNHIIPAMSKLV